MQLAQTCGSPALHLFARPLTVHASYEMLIWVGICYMFRVSFASLQCDICLPLHLISSAVLQYDLKGATSILGQGYYPPSVTYDLRPTTCFYTSPSGDFYEGDVVNVTPNREATLDELADGSWSAGLTLKIVCDNFRVQYAGKATLDVPYVSQAKASACVDMLWPNAPNHVRRARIRQAMTSKAADQPTAPFMPTQIARFQPYSRQYQNGPTPRTYIGEVISELQLMMMYGGFKTDTGVLDATKTGEQTLTECHSHAVPL